MDPIERLKLYAIYVETSRKWVSVMDVKAGFFSALNGALLALLLGPAKLADGTQAMRWICFVSIICSLFALLAALFTITPRESIKAVFGGKMEWKSWYKPVSFYGYVAKTYSPQNFDEMASEFGKMDIVDFSREMLEQHLTISGVALRKSLWVSRCSKLTIAAIVLATVGLILRALEI
jgi:hypothetical protein